MLSEMADASPNEIMAELGELLLKADQWAILRMSGLTDLIARLRTESVISRVNQRGIEAARAISRSLPHPFLNDKDQPVVPSITEAVLDRFGDDDQVKQGFITGGGMRSYFSEPSVYQRKLKLASSLLSHRLAAVREWAQVEKASVEQLIQLERQEFEERPR